VALLRRRRRRRWRRRWWWRREEKKEKGGGGGKREKGWDRVSEEEEGEHAFAVPSPPIPGKENRQHKSAYTYRKKGGREEVRQCLPQGLSS